jgi:low affinity Fe/Cu permease
MTETTKKGAGLAITGFILGILALVFCWCPILNWILAILGVIFGLIGLFINRLKGLALIGVIAAVAAICIWKFYYVPKIQNAAGDPFKEVIENVDKEKVNEAIQEAAEAVQEAAEAAPAES